MPAESPRPAALPLEEPPSTAPPLLEGPTPLEPLPLLPPLLLPPSLFPSEGAFADELEDEQAASQPTTAMDARARPVEEGARAIIPVSHPGSASLLTKRGPPERAPNLTSRTRFCASSIPIATPRTTAPPIRPGKATSERRHAHMGLTRQFCHLQLAGQGRLGDRHGGRRWQLCGIGERRHFGCFNQTLDPGIVLTEWWNGAVWADQRSSTCPVTRVTTHIDQEYNCPGNDYKSIALGQARVSWCGYYCSQDSRCNTFAYVPPGVQGPSAMCWLKPPDSCNFVYAPGKASGTKWFSSN